MTYLKARKPNELKVKDLKWMCNLDLLDFDSTKSIKPSDEIIGQERALKSLKIGVEMRSPGYNVFITGLSGTGKFTTVKKMLKSLRPECPELFDYAYVNNFKDNDRPILLKFPAGDGKKFKEDLSKTIKFLQNQIPKALQGDQFVNKKKDLMVDLSKKQQNLMGKFEEKLRKNNFTLGQVKIGEIARPEILAVIDDEPIFIQQLDEYVASQKISKRKANSITKKYANYQQELQQIVQETLYLNREFEERISELERESVEYIVNAAVESLEKKYLNKEVKKYLSDLHENVLDNLEIFKSQQNREHIDESGNVYIMDFFRDYEVNVILDNSEMKECPVVIETSPTYTNIFGTIDKYNDGSGSWHADFSRIRAGSLLRANGGYLVINAMDAFQEPGVWQTLKRVLLYGKLEIHDLASVYYLAPSVLKPESIDVNTNIILIGNNHIYSLLSNYEDDFNKIFKIKSEFDYEMNRTEKAVIEYTRVIKKLIDDENLLDFERNAVAQIIEYGSRYAGRKDKLTTRFAYIADITRESSFWAKDKGAKIVEIDHVKEAYIENRERHGLFEYKMQEIINEGTIIIDTSGERIGQINGLAVYSSGMHSFGKPTRITATVSLGKGSILNVEREVGLSGKTHDKGILIISGFFRETFGMNNPLSFNASIVFEQGYGMIDGDSASVAEICALLSCLSGIPIKQSLAITGSVNQKGDIQPIGGVNEKIEGFYDICKSKGLNGDHGVIIPELNIQDLMLKNEVLDEVEKGRFHIYSVKRIEDAIELLTGIRAGDKLKTGKFQKNTIFGLVETNLENMHIRMIKANKLKAK